MTVYRGYEAEVYYTTDTGKAPNDSTVTWTRLGHAETFEIRISSRGERHYEIGSLFADVIAQSPTEITLSITTLYMDNSFVKNYSDQSFNWTAVKLDVNPSDSNAPKIIITGALDDSGNLSGILQIEELSIRAEAEGWVTEDVSMVASKIVPLN